MSQSLASHSQTKPLSELYIFAHGGRFFNIASDLSFHNQKKEPALYDIKFSGLRSRTSRLHLFSSETKKKQENAAIARAYFDKFSKDTKLQIPVGSEWSNMNKQGGRYRWAVPAEFLAGSKKLDDLESGKEEADQDGVTKTFIWERLPKSNEEEKQIPSFAHPDWKLKDEKTGEVHAALLWKIDGTSERGNLQFRRSFGEMWERGF